jgi:hypothetical protein
VQVFNPIGSLNVPILPLISPMPNQGNATFFV